MQALLSLFKDPITLFILLTIILVIVLTVYHFQINVTGIIRDNADKALDYRFKLDNEKTRKREQLQKMGKSESIWKQKYRMAVSSIKIALNLTFLSVENFTTLFLIFGALIWVVVSFVLNNFFLGFLIAFPSIFALLAFLLVLTKKKIRANDNAVMDALDAICPSVNLGITNAIKSSRDSFDRRIAHHFDWFLGAIEFRGYSFDEAIDELSNRLGPRFIDFAHKAKIFEEHYKSGMEDIFKDIIEQNNDVRTDNAELDEIFQKKNQDLLMVSLLIIAFIVYMYISPMTSTFMLGTLGTVTTAVELSLLIIIYAVSQLLQVDIPEVEEEKYSKE